MEIVVQPELCHSVGDACWMDQAGAVIRVRPFSLSAINPGHVIWWWFVVNSFAFAVWTLHPHTTNFCAR